MPFHASGSSQSLGLKWPAKFLWVLSLCGRMLNEDIDLAKCSKEFGV